MLEASLDKVTSDAFLSTSISLTTTLKNRRQFLQTCSAGTLGLGAWLSAGGCISPDQAGSLLLNLYIGTYTNGDSKGIYRYNFDASTGELAQGNLVAVADNPSFLAIHPTGNWLYAVNELTSFLPTGSWRQPRRADVY